MTTERPSGRVGVMSAILDSAAELFADKGPAATSIREVARHSGVNHGLVYRHFGTKDELVSAVLNHVSEQLSEAVAAADGRVAELAEQQLRVLSRSILDGYPVGRMQRNFPFVTRLVEEASARTDDVGAARLTAAHVVALELGWRLFAPFIRSATGLDDVPERDLRRASVEMGRRMLAEPSTTWRG